MSKVRRVLVEALTIIGIPLGIILMIAVTTIAQDGRLAKELVWLFGLFSFAANIVTLNKLRLAGLLYTIGWLTGSLLVINFLSPFDIVFNIIGSIIIIILRISFWIKSAFWG
jgi:hypothetical protein